MEQSVSELTNLLRRWEDEMPTPNYNPIPTLIKLCELFEAESKNYLKKDPDPFDDRHPSRIDPTCVLGQMYKILFRKDSLMNKLVMDYLKEHHWPRRTKDNHDLNVAACRLIMNLIPGLETTVVFESPANDQLIQRLFTWAENTSEPLQTYATGLLASCMELTDIAANFKEDNNKLVPIILDRLHSYYTQFCEENEINQSTEPYQNTISDEPSDDTGAPSPKKKKREENGICGDSNSSFPESNASNWIQIYPPTLTTKLVYCLKYLVPTGEYQEFLSHAYEKNALNLVMKIINSSEKQNGYLTFEALKYLAALLCHKKFATEFIGSQGLQKLLLIPKPSIPSTGVSICFYYLSYCEEAMERICLLPEHVLVDLVKYALWMLECSHDSSRCHATMFFSYSFHFRVIQEIFDNHDGLRKLFNVVSTLPILSSDDPAYSSLTEDAECSARQIIRHVCAGLKHYFEAHLHIKAQQIRRAKMRDSGLLISSTMVHNFFTVPGYKSSKKSRAEVQEEIELLSNAVSLKSHWTPIDQLLKLGGLSLLLRIISLAHEWNFSGRHECEMIKNALEVLNICAVLPKVQLALCEIPSPKVPTDNQNDTSTVEENDPQAENDNVGLNIIIKAAEGDLLDADIQKAALSVIITCVCAPIHRESGSIAYYSSHGSAKKRTPKTCDDAVIEKIWDCIRNNNGIMVLLTLMTIKTPITDVDAIRGLASRALAGLARSESVRQIISKLPLFNTGQLQSLMKNPVLQEKRQEHVTFQKYALELIELVAGKKKSNGAEIEASLANINRANVVAQTKINFNEQQLLLLMHQHLMAKGLSTTAESLVQEANLNIAEKKSTPFTYISHCRNRSIGGGISPISSRHAIQNQKSELANSSNGPLGAGFSARGINSTPIRLNVNRRSENRPKPEPEQELESPMSKSVHKKIDQDLTLLTDNNTNSKVSLESIVTEYLTNQHASCKHPMVTCPQFNLFVPHKCPDPKPKSSMCTNFAMRFSKNIHSRKLNQRLIHSRFCPTRNFHMDDEEAYFTCCEFLSQNRVAIGTYNGEIKVFNLFTSQEELSFSAHDSYIIDLQCSNDERLLLSSASWRAPLTSIWSITEDAINIKYSLDHEEYCTFSNYDQNKILGTKAEIATIYDLETSKRILTLVPKHSNQYSRNRAAFDATNELVLSDGVLWDAIAGKEIHKFDKLNQCVSGIFHPNGLEIISNTEVWDMRTFQLLRTVSSLDQCNVTFSKSGEGMYLYVIDQEIENDSSYQTSFKTLDPNDYSNIATVDVKKFIYHMACNSYDTQIAIVENQGMFENIDESIVRIYDVGRSRNEDEAVEEEDDEDVDSEGSGSEDENMSMFPSYLEEMLAGGMAAGGMSDNFSSGSSSNSSFESGGESSRSFTPLSDSSNDASYDAGINSDPENLGA
ncbi:DDB1- and CUL4-associated factor 1 isoform X1 [Acyrthosiphon pisum]|uniref:Protein mahjong n=1 Tax=Acyrthosiphon pisum TaxID=7029 RepID=A0A8R2B6V1_ACYPI|nr:DDB1- and CUL4-associated factor 1 isoform X1 [Acyrthosiphon pisum]|eukprot:XP_008184180.1 PREDICTED: protein VPRBP isoform X1 [Acyrthosiphon pisum]